MKDDNDEMEKKELEGKEPAEKIPEEKELPVKAEKQKKPMSMGKKWAVLVAMAVFFGQIAGSIMYGINAAGNRIQAASNIEETKTVSDDTASDSDNSSDGESTAVEEVTKNAMPSVVTISTMSVEEMRSFFGGTQQYEVEGAGTGVIVGENDSELLIATNNHVVEGGDSIAVTLDDGETYAAELIGTDVKSDIAVLKIDAQNLPAAEFGDSSQVEVGEAAIAIGNPLGLNGTVTAGIISAVDREIQVGSSNMVLLQTDASINPGNSGGALLNEYGQVIGVNSAKISSEDSEGLGFAIPSNTVEPIVEELIDKGYVSGRPLTGISGRNVSALAAAFYNIPQGILVDQVAPESDAAAKGLTAGDVIIGVDDIRVENISDACTLRDEHKAGDTMKLTFYRQGSTHEINIQLMEETNQQSEYDF